MAPEHWDQVKRVFQDALEVPDDQRGAFVASACDGAPDLRLEVERLLALHDRSGEFLETPVVQGTQVDPPAMVDRRLPAGSRVSSYTVQQVIGEGGMGVVYHAIQDGTQRQVALKVLRPALATRETVRRFQQEARLLGQLQHSGVTQIIETGTSETESGERLFLAMELVDGLPVTRYARERDLSVAQKLDLLADIADAVHHAHQKGVIHRDLKPANILVESTGRPKVLDFGVARTTGADIYVTSLRTTVGKLIGTIPYMSPEQVAGDPRELDRRSDVYALGVIGYELLTGRLPYELEDKPIPEAIRIIANDDPTPLSSISRTFRGDIDTMLSKALEKDRRRRYDSAAEFAADIRSFLQDEAIIARRTSALYRLRKFTRRNKGLSAGVVLAFLALLVGMGVATWQGLRAKEELRTANAVNLFLHDLLESPFSKAHDRDVTILQLFEEVPDELETRFPDRPDVKAPIYLAVGNTYQQVGLADKAESYVRRGYECSLQAHGETHQKTLNAMAWLALVLERQGKLAEAEKMGRRLLHIYTRMHGPESVFPLGAIANLASVLCQQDRFRESEMLLRDALAHHDKIQAPDGANSLYAIAILSRCLTATGRLNEAANLAEKAYEGFCRLFGENDWRPLFALSSKARVWQAQGRTEEAERLMRDVLEDRRRVLGDRHPGTITSLYDLGSILASRGEFAEALALAEEALSRADGVMRPEHWRLAQLQHLRGTCQLDLNMPEQAEANLTKAYHILEITLGRVHPETQATLRQIIELYDVEGRIEPATRYRKLLANTTGDPIAASAKRLGIPGTISKADTAVSGISEGMDH